MQQLDVLALDCQATGFAHRFFNKGVARLALYAITAGRGDDIERKRPAAGER